MLETLKCPDDLFLFALWGPLLSAPPKRFTATASLTGSGIQILHV